MEAFWTLSTERQVSQGAIGQIPWSAAMRYASFRGVEGSMLRAFWKVISAMDDGFREWQRGEHDRHVRMNQPKAKPGQRTRSRKT